MQFFIYFSKFSSANKEHLLMWKLWQKLFRYILHYTVLFLQRIHQKFLRNFWVLFFWLFKIFAKGSFIWYIRKSFFSEKLTFLTPDTLRHVRVSNFSENFAYVLNECSPKFITKPFARTIFNGFFTLKYDWFLSWSFLSAVPEDLSSEYNKLQTNKLDYSILKLAFSF